MVREAYELLDGSKPIPIDRISYELAQYIMFVFDNFENLDDEKEIEIEARIGMLIDKNMNRLNFPIYTDAIIDNEYSNFVAGVEEKYFNILLNNLNNKLSNNDFIENKKNENRNFNEFKRNENVNENIYNFVKIDTQKCVDKMYLINVNNTSDKILVRVTNPLNNDDKNNDNMIKTIHKENITTWNIFSGIHFDDEDDDDYEISKRKKVSIDYRISVNIEHAIKVSKLYLSKLKPNYERYKERTSFINKYLGLQFDFTKIKQKNGQNTYEIEIEIRYKTILKAINYVRNNNDFNYLYFICSNLINNIRSICYEIYQLEKKKNISDNFMDSLSTFKRDYHHPLKEQKLFQKYINKTLPLIGDYIYNIATKNEKNILEKMSEINISNEEKLNIFKNTIDIKNSNKMMKLNKEYYEEDKWKIIEKDGKKIIVNDIEKND